MAETKLSQRLRTTASRIIGGEVAWGSDASLMNEAADALEAAESRLSETPGELKTTAAERAEWRRENRWNYALLENADLARLLDDLDTLISRNREVVMAENEACAAALDERAVHYRKRASEVEADGYREDARQYRVDAAACEWVARSIRSRHKGE